MTLIGHHVTQYMYVLFDYVHIYILVGFFSGFVILTDIHQTVLETSECFLSYTNNNMHILASGTEYEAVYSGHAIHSKVKMLPLIPNRLAENYKVKCLHCVYRVANVLDGRRFSAWGGAV